jgi:hypothetical protein
MRLHPLHKDVPPSLQEALIVTGSAGLFHLARCSVEAMMPWLYGSNEMHNFHIGTVSEVRRAHYDGSQSW